MTKQHFEDWELAWFGILNKYYEIEPDMGKAWNYAADEYIARFSGVWPEITSSEFFSKRAPESLMRREL